MKYVLALIATITLSALAAAHDAHGAKGPNGGQMEDVAGVHAELMTAGNTITINVFDEGNKPIATKGFIASALVSRGLERETVALVPSGEATLTGEAKKACCRSCHHGHAENRCGEVRAGQIQAVEPSNSDDGGKLIVRHCVSTRRSTPAAQMGNRRLVDNDLSPR